MAFALLEAPNTNQRPGPGRLFRNPAATVSRLSVALRRDRRGATAMAFGLSATVVMGFAGLAVEGGSWYVTRRAAQTAADTAAFAGATTVAFQGAAITVARETTARNGFTNGVDDTTVTVNNPPTSGSAVGDVTAVEVIVRRQVPMQLAALFVGGNTEISARSVARAQILEGGQACVLTLGHGAPAATTLSFGGNGIVSATRCSLASNASISQSGSSAVQAFTMRAVGSISIADPQAVVLDRPATSRQAPVVDPFAPGTPTTGIPLPPATGTCTVTAASIGSNQSGTLSPGRYCRSGSKPPIEISGNAQLTPGVYYLEGGDLDIGAQASVTCPTCTAGNGVTFVFTGNPSDIGGPKINGGATVSLIGGSAGYTGVLMYQDPRIAAPGTYTLNGGAAIATEGLYYFPASDLSINGNFGGSASSCKAFTSAALSVSGSSELHVETSGCEDLGLNPQTQLPQLSIVRLTE